MEPLTAIVRFLLIALGILFIYLGYRKTLEPLIMIPMGIGMIGVNGGVLIWDAAHTGNLFVDPMLSEHDQLLNTLQIDFLQPIYNFAFSNGLIACLVFMGIGAITDLDYLMAKPLMSMVIAVAAELGTILTLPIGVAAGLTPNEAASIALVGGGDGPMVLYGSLMMAKDLFVPITVVAYLYLSVCYAGYPYLIKLLIPKRLRGIEMDPAAIPEVSAGKKLAFSIVALAVLSLLFPVAAPLFASFFVGVAVKEAGVTRYVEFLSGPLLYGSTLFLGFVLGALLSAEVIMDSKVLLLLGLGMLALLLSGIGGLIGGLIYYKLSKKKVNPLIGIAGVSCVPTTAKVAQKCAAESNVFAMILPYAMGPCVAGVITTAIITGIYVSGVPHIF
jgi:sodium ion-translocating decarboxylase beta subunit